MTVFRVFSYLRRYPLLATAQLSCAVLMTLLYIVFPEITRTIVDDVIPNKETDRLLNLSLLAAGAFLLTNLFNALRILLNNTFEQRVIFDLRSDLYQRIQRLPMTWFDNKRTGDVMTRVTEDVTATERVLIDGIETGIVASLQVLITGAYMFVVSPQLAAVALIPMPFLIGGALFYTLTAADRYRGVRRATSAMNSLLHDNIDGIQQIKSFTRETAELERFNQSSNKLRAATLRVMRAWAVYNPSMEWFRNLGYALVVGIGAFWVIRGDFSLGVFTAFLVILALFYEPITRLHGLNQIFQAGRAAAERVFDFLDTPEEINAHSGNQLPTPIKGHIQFKNVSFTYHPAPTKPLAADDDSEPSHEEDEEEKRPLPSEAHVDAKASHVATLSHITLDALPGQTIALVGPTGAGKSTIINLLNRFYEYDQGTITIDGADIQTLAKPALRAQLGYVTQESFLFNDSVRYNLALAKPDASDQELWDALDTANAANFVRALPENLDTNVGERGVKLSVGEKQRLAIARALLKNPPILLLDEATASVDNETERLIQQALDRLLEDRTSFVVAHRLSTIRNADTIYCLDQGRIVESGTHENLLAQNGLYAELASHAFSDDPLPIQ
ncbi:MAG: ABC transporter ATP-binding protein [Verrucomicrobiota bacterium]